MPTMWFTDDNTTSSNFIRSVSEQENVANSMSAKKEKIHAEELSNEWPDNVH